jgi:hypothetical protein
VVDEPTTFSDRMPTFCINHRVTGWACTIGRPPYKRVPPICHLNDLVLHTWFVSE